MSKVIHHFSIIVVLILMSGRLAFGQEKPFPFKARNALYFELRGQNLAYSLNYDRLVASTKKGNWLFGYRVGGSLLGKHLVESRVISEIYALLGKQKSHLEVGISGSLGRNWQYDHPPYGGAINVLVSPLIAYRFQAPNGISFFRVSLSPSLTINGQENNNTHGLLFGLGFGRSF